jgi:hypothetical protein
VKRTDADMLWCVSRTLPTIGLLSPGGHAGTYLSIWQSERGPTDAILPALAGVGNSKFSAGSHKSFLSIDLHRQAALARRLLSPFAQRGLCAQLAAD